jgi:peroxisomal 2,4-dienoyl-CoA reductase
MLSEIGKAYLRHGAKAVYFMARKVDKLQVIVNDLLQYGQAFAIGGDVRDPKSCQSVVKTVVDAQGKIDVLVNGAAGNFLASAEKLSANGFKTVFEIDTLGTFNMSQSVFNAGMKKNGGVIINISANLHWNGTALQAHSAAAKAGVDALTRVLACEWGPYNVRVCGIVPGAISGTEGFERLGNMSNMNNRSATEKAGETKSSSAKEGNLL